jgi:NAD(P)-dependent dehydrogenase (short-subunit alcohol dehydrogenase family)
VINITRGVAIEYAARGIRANSILPGLMDTPHIYQQITTFYASVEEMVEARHKLSPTGRMGTAWDIANAAVFLASDDAAYINGVELPVDGGLHVKAGV